MLQLALFFPKILHLRPTPIPIAAKLYNQNLLCQREIKYLTVYFFVNE